MPANYKDVTIGENQYRIGLLKAADGGWIFSTFVKRYRAYKEANPSDESQPETIVAPVDPEVGFAVTAAFLVEQLGRGELAEVQALCLSVCGRYDSRLGSPIAKPILFADGRYAIPELEFDAPAVLELTKQCIAFNIAPFFPAAGLNVNQNPALDSSQLSTQA
jgi:hypothetical protein